MQPSRQIEDAIGGGPLKLDEEGNATCTECGAYRGHCRGIVFVAMPNPHKNGCSHADEEHSCSDCGWTGTGFHACPGRPGSDAREED